MKIRLRHVNKSDYKFLFRILSERNPNSNISHRKMPSYKEHLAFIRSKPYPYWYVIEIGRSKIGSIYLTTDNEIGIHLKKNFCQTRTLQDIFNILKLLQPRNRYYVNISPKNTKLTNFFKNNGFTLRQVTYAIDYT